MTADVGTVIRVPVTYPPDHSLFAAAQMADDGRRVLHGTSIRAGLGIISGGFNDSKVGPGSKTLTKKFAANGSWAEGRSPRAVYSTTLATTAEVYEYFAMTHYPDDCLLPDTPITVARVAAQLAPSSLLVRIAPTRSGNDELKNEQLLTRSEDTTPRELVLSTVLEPKKKLGDLHLRRCQRRLQRQCLHRTIALMRSHLRKNHILLWPHSSPCRR